MSPYRSHEGLTLIEVIVAIVIIGMLVSLAVMGIQNVTRAHLRSAAGQLAGAIKYTYDQAVITGSFYRIAFDLEENSYKVESSDDLFFLTMEESGSAEERKAKEEEEVEEEEENLGGYENPATVKLKRAQFSEVKSETLKPIKFKSNIAIDGVYTGHQAERFTEGLAYLYFFPQGRTEFAIIQLTDSDNNTYSLKVSSLSGKVKIYSRALDVKDEAIQERVEEEFKSR